MLLPTIVLLFVFCYLPIYGVVMAFQDYKVGDSLIGANTQWVGFKYFAQFFHSIYFGTTFGNTLRLSLETLLFGFWVPIVFALLLNEVRLTWFKRMTQTFVYLPYFISTVVVVALLMTMTSSSGIITQALSIFGFKPVDMINNSKYFDTLYVGSGIWQTFGYSSIIYVAAMASIDPALYEAATVDGANRLHKMLHITLPGIWPTVIILLILAVGQLLNSNTEKVLLMLNSMNTDKANVIGTYIYNTGLRSAQYSYSAAVGLFTNAINFVLVFGANLISRRVSNTSLW